MSIQVKDLENIRIIDPYILNFMLTAIMDKVSEKKLVGKPVPKYLFVSPQIYSQMLKREAEFYRIKTPLTKTNPFWLYGMLVIVSDLLSEKQYLFK